jgi:hypothetical protein
MMVILAFLCFEVKWEETIDGSWVSVKSRYRKELVKEALKLIFTWIHLNLASKIIVLIYTSNTKIYQTIFNLACKTPHDVNQWERLSRVRGTDFYIKFSEHSVVLSSKSIRITARRARSFRMVPFYRAASMTGRPQVEGSVDSSRVWQCHRIRISCYFIICE